MARRDGPTWPVSVNVVRVTLARSRLDTLHKPEIAILQQSHRYGWARYSACVAWPTYELFETPFDFYHQAFYAFCEPLSDFRIDGIDEGVLMRFTLYVSRNAARLRKDKLHMKWEDWATLFK